MDTSSENRLRIVAALAVLRDGDASALLAEYVAEEDRSMFSEHVSSFLGSKDRDAKMEKIVRQMVARERFTNLAEVHPAWILERLVEETPRIIGIILRALPVKHVTYILKNMPPMLRAQIPNIVESFAVPVPVLDVIRRRFERHFLPVRVSRSVRAAGFENIYYLNEEELCELIREVGLTELAMALSGLPGRTLAFVFNRLKVKDAKRLKQKMGEVKGGSIDLIRQARSTIFEVRGSHLGPDKMLLRIGLAALAMAIHPDEFHLIRLLQQRLEPSDGYLLKRFVDERRTRAHGETAEIRRNLILDSITSLAKEGRIDPSWKGFFSGPEDDPSEISEDLPKASQNEETATVPLLA